jgi:dephospho-CoA kinase
MRVIGIVGPAGSGKSTVARCLEGQPGVARLDCDELAWETYRPGRHAYSGLVAAFGEGVLASDGTVDRKRLAAAALSSSQGRHTLERIVHPEVMAAVAHAVAEHAAKGTKWLLVEGALLLASPHVDRSLFDAFLWIEVPISERRRRLVEAGLNAGTVEGRLAAQRDLAPPSDERVYLLDGRGSPEDVARRARALLDRIGSA